MMHVQYLGLYEEKLWMQNVGLCVLLCARQKAAEESLVMDVYGI